MTVRREIAESRGEPAGRRPVAAVNWRCSRSAHESCGLIPVIDGLHAITGAMKGHLLAERPDQREPATEHRIIRG